MLKEDNKQFLESSINSSGNLEKFYILTLVQDSKELEGIIENPPYRIIEPIYSNIEVLGTKLNVPGLIKDIAIYNHKTREIYTDIDNYNIKIEAYKEDLYKIIRLIQIIRNNISNLEFWMMKTVYNILDNINKLIVDYDNSINLIGNYKLRSLIRQIKTNFNNLDSLLSNRSSFIDSQTGRLYTIMSIISLPLIFTGAWFGMNFDTKGQMLFTRYNYSYLIVSILCTSYIILCFYTFGKDLINFV